MYLHAGGMAQIKCEHRRVYTVGTEFRSARLGFIRREGLKAAKKLKKQGINVTIDYFSDLGQFSAKKWAFFLKTNVMM
jgi:hypothetical protein